MLVNFIKCVLGLVCSSWKRVLRAPVFHSGRLMPPWCAEGCGTAATLFHSLLCPFFLLWRPCVFHFQM